MGGDVVNLIVQGDDFGMCHAVNEGVRRAFDDGIVTQASVMAACPWFSEAAEMATSAAIPVGLHQTLTSEWDYLRWGPLTGAKSLSGTDRTFPRTVAEAQAMAADADADAVAELMAQAARATDAGLELTYTDVHMGMVAPAAYQVVADRLGVPFLYPGLDASVAFTSISTLSARPASEKGPWLLRHLKKLQPGQHLIVSHPAVADVELAAITAAGSQPAPWAAEYRVSDLDVLTDPAVRTAIDDLGIHLVALAGLHR